MRSGVDEVAERYESGGKTDGGAIESGDQDLRMCVEGIGDFEIVRYEALERLAPNISGSWERFGNCDIGATVW